MSYFKPILDMTVGVILTALGAVNACQPLQAQEMTARQQAVPDDVWKQMQSRSWRPNLNCPVRSELVLLTLPYQDFHGNPQMGQMIVAKRIAGQVSTAFMTIFQSKDFRIERMELIDKYMGDDGRSMAANNTSAFNCRPVTGGKRLSSHAYGTAIDINPIQNPWVNNGKTDPPAGESYNTNKKRNGEIIGLIRPDGIVVKAFRAQKWKWGGDWITLKDYQHFSEDGK